MRNPIASQGLCAAYATPCVALGSDLPPWLPKFQGPVQREMSELVRTRVELNPIDFSSGNKRRTPGLHLTDVIKDIMRDMGVDRSRAGFDEEQLAAFQLQGYLWEDVFAEKLRDYLNDKMIEVFKLEAPYEHCPELAVSLDWQHAFYIWYDEQGELMTPVPPGYIIMSPDLFSLRPRRLGELKWTTLSVNMRPEEKRPEWFIQTKGYLRGLSIWLGEEFTEVEWPIFFACGDYRGSGPIFEMWQRSFSVNEQMDCCEMITGHARHKAQQEGHPWASYL